MSSNPLWMSQSGTLFSNGGAHTGLLFTTSVGSNIVVDCRFKLITVEDQQRLIIRALIKPLYFAYSYLQVQRHLGKLFDNMAKLEFEKDDNDVDTKVALGMYSSEGEYVEFKEACECVGQVR